VEVLSSPVYPWPSLQLSLLAWHQRSSSTRSNQVPLPVPHVLANRTPVSELFWLTAFTSMLACPLWLECLSPSAHSLWATLPSLRGLLQSTGAFPSLCPSNSVPGFLEDYVTTYVCCDLSQESVSSSLPQVIGGPRTRSNHLCLSIHTQKFSTQGQAL
jgi:hypothetical protein